MIANQSAFSLRSGNWFISPLFVWGSESVDSEILQLYFDRKLYEDMQILIQDEHDTLLLFRKIQTQIQEFQCEISGWPEGTYTLIIQDKDKISSYRIIKE